MTVSDESHKLCFNSKYVAERNVYHYDVNNGNRRVYVSYKKSILKNFEKFTRKHLRQSLFFNNVYQNRDSGHRNF